MYERRLEIRSKFSHRTQLCLGLFHICESILVASDES
jgi:hypothetical protein